MNRRSLTRPRRQRTAPSRLGLLVVAVLLLSACEAVTVNRVNTQRSEGDLSTLEVSSFLQERARDRAATMCAEGAVSPTASYEDDYLLLGPEQLDGAGEMATRLAELVGSAPLDPTIEDPGQRNGAAGNLLWDGWRNDPTLDDPRWDTIGVGEHECADGTLYSAMVLRDDPPALDEPADTSQIVAAETVTSGGWTWQRYRNLAYPCASSGYHSFLIGTKDGSSASATSPLWVRMRGGGAGYYDADGAPKPGDSFKNEESMEVQLGYSGGTLLNAAKASSAGFRVLVVSMCSHDIYAGNQTFDPFNPNRTPDGETRPTSGLNATKAAVQFTRGLLPTDDMVLHGTSAGGYGVYHVGWALQRQGIPPAALISDSGVLNQAWLSYVASAGIPGSTGCEKNDEERAYGVLGRVDPEILDPANEPHLLVADGRLEVPVMHVWNQGDHALCGSVPIPCPFPDGSTPTLWAADCQHQPMRLAIEALNVSEPDNPSTYLRLCVEGNRPEPCDRHTPTGANTPNTDPGAPANFNAAILAWVHERLDD